MINTIELRAKFSTLDDYRQFVVDLIYNQTTYEKCELVPQSIYQLEHILAVKHILAELDEDIKA